ncbi:unnamed protein product [Camellia sinensis]
MSENRYTIDEKERKKEEGLSRSLGTIFVPVDLTPHYIPPRRTPPAPSALSSSSSSSTTLKTSATAGDTEVSGKANLKRSGQGKNVVVSPFKKPKDVIMTHDYDDVDVISESKSGDSTKRPSQGLQDRPDTYERDPPLFHISTKVGEFHRGILLFEIKLSASDIELGRLAIPVERAMDYFSPLSIPKVYEEQIEITDTQKDDWYMTLTYDPVECTFMISIGWQGFVEWHELEAMDVIRFYRPVPRVHNNHFLIDYIKGQDAETNNIVQEFRQENFLFQLQLTPTDVGYCRIIIPKEDVRTHFPAVKIPTVTHKMERLYFTDTQNKDWCMKIIFSSQVDAYMIINGWGRFVKKHNLEAMDVIRFYKPVQPLHGWHFLIDCVKGEKAKDSMIELGKAKNDGNGGDGSKKGGDNKEGGDRGGVSESGGSSCGKGKIICCWGWKNQRGGPERAVMMTLEEILEMIFIK